MLQSSYNKNSHMYVCVCGHSDSAACFNTHTCHEMLHYTKVFHLFPFTLSSLLSLPPLPQRVAQLWIFLIHWHDMSKRNFFFFFFLANMQKVIKLSFLFSFLKFSNRLYILKFYCKLLKTSNTVWVKEVQRKFYENLSI